MSETPSSGDLFELVGQEARMSILRALLTARRESEDPYCSFTELKDAAGIDDAGRFNYHLGKLVGTVVTRTDDGYRLSNFGFRVLAPMTSGMYDPDPVVDEVEVPGACHECGESLHVETGESVLRVVCTEGHTVFDGILGYPGALSGRSSPEAREMLGLLNAQAIELGVAGICPLCHGRTEGGVEWDDEADYYVFRAPCENCGNQFSTSVGSCAATHPDIVGFLADRGVDVRRVVPWSFPFGRPGAEEIVSEAPLRLRVTVGDDETDESLSVVIDRSGSVVATRRE